MNTGRNIWAFDPPTNDEMGARAAAFLFLSAPVGLAAWVWVISALAELI
ncbi:MAG: hypothetical protein AAGA70_02625 [Pseudomonadota bacterium]